MQNLNKHVTSAVTNWFDPLWIVPRDLTGISNELTYVELQRVQRSIYLYLQQFCSINVPYFKHRNEVICTIFQLEARKPPWNGSLVPTWGHPWNAGERWLGLWISTQLMIPQKYERPTWLSLPTDVLSPWWRHQMETFSALLAIFGGEFTGHRPVMWSFDIFFDLYLE